MQCYATTQIISKQKEKIYYKIKLITTNMQLTICNNYSLQPNTPKLKSKNAHIIIKSERILS